MTIHDTPHDKNSFRPPVFPLLQSVIVSMGERPKLYPGFPVEPPPGLLDLSRHYPRHVLDRLAHFPRFPPSALPGTLPDPSSVHIKRERRESLNSVAYLQHPVKTEPADQEEEVGQDLSYHAREQEAREHYESGGRELPRSFSLPAPREPPPPQRQVSLERGREGGVAPPNPKPETSSRTLIGNKTLMKMHLTLTANVWFGQHSFQKLFEKQG